MNDFFYFLIFLVILPSLTRAQEYLYKGYYIDKKNEKIELQFYIHPDSLYWDHFVAADPASSRETIISVHEARMVNIPGTGRYEARQLLHPDSSITEVFFKVLVKGAASLYQYPLSDEIYLFIETPPNGFYPLSNKEIIYNFNFNYNNYFDWKVDENNPVQDKENQTTPGNKFKISRPFTRQLLYILRDCPPLQNRIRNTNYDIQSMLSLVERYNKCVAGKSEYSDKPDRRDFMEIGPMALWELSGFTYKHARILGKTEGLDKIVLRSPTSFAVGAYADFMNLKSNRRSSFRIYAYFLKSSYHAVNEPLLLEGLTADYQYDLIYTEFNDLFLSTQFTKYLTLRNGHRWNFELGPYFGFPLDSYNTYIQYRETNITFPASPTTTWKKHLTHSFTVGLSAGLSYNIPFHNSRSFSIFAQGGVATYNISLKGNLGYKLGAGVKIDLY